MDSIVFSDPVQGATGGVQVCRARLGRPDGPPPAATLVDARILVYNGGSNRLALFIGPQAMPLFAQADERALGYLMDRYGEDMEADTIRAFFQGAQMRGQPYGTVEARISSVREPQLLEWQGHAGEAAVRFDSWDELLDHTLRNTRVLRSLYVKAILECDGIHIEPRHASLAWRVAELSISPQPFAAAEPAASDDLGPEELDEIDAFWATEVARIGVLVDREVERLVGLRSSCQETLEEARAARDAGDLVAWNAALVRLADLSKFYLELD